MTPPAATLVDVPAADDAISSPVHAAFPTAPTRAAVHPIVLLSIVDHYHRLALPAASSTARAVGILLGSHSASTTTISSSFAVPFEQDPRNPSVFFLDHNYVEVMLGLLRKVNAGEVMVGWYSTGVGLRVNDGLIGDVLMRRVGGANGGRSPIALVVDVNHTSSRAAASTAEDDVPARAYYPVQVIHSDGTPSERTFIHVPTIVEAEEAEEVGVEHLLRDVNADSVARTQTIAGQAADRLQALVALADRLARIGSYLDRVQSGAIPAQGRILARLQDAMNLLPEVAVGADGVLVNEEMRRAVRYETHDAMMVMYVAGLVRAAGAMHALVDNQVERKQAEQSLDGVGTEEKLENEAKGEETSVGSSKGEKKTDDSKS